MKKIEKRVNRERLMNKLILITQLMLINHSIYRVSLFKKFCTYLEQSKKKWGGFVNFNFNILNDLKVVFLNRRRGRERSISHPEKVRLQFASFHHFRKYCWRT